MRRFSRGCFRLVMLLLVAITPSCAAPRTAWGTRLADWVMQTWPDPWEIYKGGWEYNAGIVLYGMGQVYRRTGERRYIEYLRRWVDHFVDAEIAQGFPIKGKVGQFDRCQNRGYAFEELFDLLSLMDAEGAEQFVIPLPICWEQDSSGIQFCCFEGGEDSLEQSLDELAFIGCRLFDGLRGDVLNEVGEFPACQGG